jgi:hypothetical protein
MVVGQVGEEVTLRCTAYLAWVADVSLCSRQLPKITANSAVGAIKSWPISYVLFKTFIVVTNQATEHDFEPLPYTYANLLKPTR